ncbi:MAG: hypothetical protein ACN2B6_01165 [Rickettsiales bacterium]
MSIKKMYLFTPEQLRENLGTRRAASKALGFNENNWAQNVRGKLVAKVNGHYFLVKDNEAFY